MDVRRDRDRRGRDGERDALPTRAERLPGAGPRAVRHPARLRLVARVDAHHPPGLLRGTRICPAAARRLSLLAGARGGLGQIHPASDGRARRRSGGRLDHRGLAAVVQGARARVRGARRRGGQSPLPRLPAARLPPGDLPARRRLRPLRGRDRGVRSGGARPRSPDCDRGPGPWMGAAPGRVVRSRRRRAVRDSQAGGHGRPLGGHSPARPAGGLPARAAGDAVDRAAAGGPVRAGTLPGLQHGVADRTLLRLPR